MWINDDSNRIFPKDISGVIDKRTQQDLYNIQFENEGTFYVDGLKIDSLSPYHCKYSLEKANYFDSSKYKDYRITDEDDPSRNKPPMTKKFIKL